MISHNHYDHLDEASVVALARQAGGAPLFLVPLGNKAWFEALGIASVVELDWWQSHRVGAVEFVLTPVQHWSGRAFGDRLKTLWGGWAMLAPGFGAFFGGDTGYSADFAEIGRRLAPRNGGGFDLAILPIGGYEPRWFMSEQHVDPGEAVRMHRDLRARRSLGMHWGTFELTDESLPHIGQLFGGRDHSTVINSLKLVGALRDANPEIRAQLDRLRRSLRD